VKIVAEIGASHNGDLNRAVETVRAAAASGADAIKLQTWIPGTMAAGGRVLDSGPWKGRYLADLYEQAWTPWEWHTTLIAEGTRLGMEWWSTPFDVESLIFLESLHCPRYKVASFEITDIPLIEAIAQTGKPIILSTGMASMEDVGDAVRACGKNHVTLLRCVSAYPADPGDFNLQTMVHMGDHWQRPVGLSDHTKSISVPVAATALGAVMIERHLTLKPEDGLDDGFASTPVEFRSMVSGVRTALAAIGEVRYGPAQAERPSVALRRSLWVVKDMARGDALTLDNLRSARPADGVHPKYLPRLLDLKVSRDIPAGSPMRWDYLQTDYGYPDWGAMASIHPLARESD
jgi:N-acetylneuraminate synthase